MTNNTERSVKQVIVIDRSKGTNIGKYVSQGAHASLGALLKMSSIRKYPDERTKITFDFEENSILDKWLNGIFTKICLSASSEEEMVSIYDAISRYNETADEKIPVVLIEDCGKTCFDGVKTKTAVGIGPFWSDIIDNFTGHLKLFR